MAVLCTWLVVLSAAGLDYIFLLAVPGARGQARGGTLGFGRLDGRDGLTRGSRVAPYGTALDEEGRSSPVSKPPPQTRSPRLVIPPPPCVHLLAQFRLAPFPPPPPPVLRACCPSRRRLWIIAMTFFFFFFFFFFFCFVRRIARARLEFRAARACRGTSSSSLRSRSSSALANAPRVRCRLVSEGANGPTTIEAGARSSASAGFPSCRTCSECGRGRRLVLRWIQVFGRLFWDREMPCSFFSSSSVGIAIAGIQRISAGTSQSQGSARGNGIWTAGYTLVVLI